MQFILLIFLTRKNLLFAFYDVNLLDNYVNTTPNIHDKLLFFIIEMFYLSTVCTCTSYQMISEYCPYKTV